MDHLASCSTWLLLERRPFSFGNRSSLATHVAILPSWELIGLEVKSEELPSTLSLLLGRDHGARFEASPQGEMEYSYHLRMELNQRLFRRLAIPLRTRPIREQCPSMASSRRSTCRTASSTCLPSGPQTVGNDLAQRGFWHQQNELRTAKRRSAARVPGRPRKRRGFRPV